MSVPSTQARYEGKCPGCGEPLDEGDRIGLVDGDWVCENCVDDAGEEFDDPDS